jgi:hypothetical protein
MPRCAPSAAQYVLAGSFNVFGDAAEGFILVPICRVNFLQESSAANPIGSSSSRLDKTLRFNYKSHGLSVGVGI